MVLFFDAGVTELAVSDINIFALNYITLFTIGVLAVQKNTSTFSKGFTYLIVLTLFK